MKKNLTRGAGVLLPISSLPSPYGIGSLGKAAYAFADQLARAKQTYWQVLPVGPTSYGDSPYQSFSSFAGNPYFIDLDMLAEEGLLRQEELSDIPWCHTPAYIDYDRQWNYRYPVLRKAFSRFDRQEADYQRFIRQSSSWLDNYALFMACKKAFNDVSWLEWPEDIRLHHAAAVKKYTGTLQEEMDFWRFLQYYFYKQWFALKSYVNRLGIKIIGDIPIYVALDSADVWAEPGQFQLDRDRRPVNVAGCPPDAFSEDGQKWGNPLYNWKHMAKENFAWWRRRISGVADLYDVIRIDHFIGIVRYYVIPAEKSAKEGWYEAGPGKALLQVIDEVCEGRAQIIAEDLGVVTPEVTALLREAGYPGMKVLEFAFGGGADSPYLPHNHISNCVLYLGTHDNDTLEGYLDKIGEGEREHLKKYFNVQDRESAVEALTRSVYMSVADVAVMQMQDILRKGPEARTNLPSTTGTNWKWRLLPGEFTREREAYLGEMAERYQRG